MKTRYLFLLVLLTLVQAACRPKGDRDALSKSTKIAIKGSDTVLPLTQKEAEAYMKENPDASITVVGGGSGVGITALMEKSTDIAMSSRPLKMVEKLKLDEAEIDYQELIIAYDALAVSVHPSNPIRQLTREQIEDIFTGKVKNWKELGGEDKKIIAYSRESSSGTYEFFKEEVLDKKNYSSSVLNMPATGAIVQSIAQTEGAIGYIGLAYETDKVRHLAVSYDKGKTYVLPSMKAAQDGSYPIARPLYYYYEVKNKKRIQSFLNFILSDKGQQLVAETGYVPLLK